MLEYTQILITEGERQALDRCFPEKSKWTRQPKLTPAGISKIARRHAELQERVNRRIGTKKHSPGLAYDVELIGRVLAKAQVKA